METNENAPEQGYDLETISIQKVAHFMDSDRLAELELKRTLQMDPDFAMAHALLGMVLFQQDRTDEAEESAQTAMALDPEDDTILGLYGTILCGMGKNSEAEAMFLSALRIDPMNASTYRSYSSLMHKTGHLNKAKRLIERGLQLSPDSASLHNAHAAVLGEENKRAESRESSQKGIALEPGGAYSHFVRGHTLLADLKPFQARAAFRQALAIEPSDEDYIESFHEVDLCCRFVYLPYFFFSRLLDRIPGNFITLWVAFIVTHRVLLAMEVREALVTTFAFSYLALAIYTWIATPLAKFWVKLRPARL